LEGLKDGTPAGFTAYLIDQEFSKVPEGAEGECFYNGIDTRGPDTAFMDDKDGII